MKRNLRYFNPYHNEVGGVKSSVEYALGQKIEKIEIMISIGFNGKEYSSSTDWLITMEDGTECIRPFFSVPQNPTFLTVAAGMDIKTNAKGMLEISATEKNAVLIMPNGEQREFEPGAPVRIGICAGNDYFVGTDCDVEVTQTENKTFYSIKPDEHTHYASFDGKMISPSHRK